MEVNGHEALLVPVQAIGGVDAGDAELVGWRTGGNAGPVPLPKLPAPRAADEADATAKRAQTVLPAKPRRRLLRR